MSLDPVCYLLTPERLEPASDAPLWLGRIVQSYAVPDADFTPRDPAPLLTAIQQSETKIADVSTFISHTHDRSLNLKLTGLASTFQRRGTHGGIQFTSPAIRHVRLQNHARALDILSHNAEVRADLARMLRPGGTPAYFIVGMLIWEDADFTDTRTMPRGGGGSVEVPIAAAVTASTGVVLPGVGVDPGVSVESKAERERSVAGRSKGSSIFAFEYRTVRRRIYSLTSHFVPRVVWYGGRVERDRVFGHTAGLVEDSGAMVEERAAVGEGAVELDDIDDGISWADLVEEELEIGRVEGLSLAFD